MFYSQVILARKGPLGKIWLAAHFDKKLTKQQIFATDLTASVDSVLNPAVPLALRVSGHLMLGIVRIYSKKVRYLMTDCTEAMWKMKLAFRPGNVDIDPQAVTVAIDDLRHFGNIQFDEESRGFEHIAFTAHYAEPGLAQGIASHSPLSDISVSSKRLERSRSMVEGRVSRLSEVEFARGEGSVYGRSPLSQQVARPPSLLHAPFSAAREQPSRISYAGDDDLVAFDDKLFEGGAEYSLSFTAREPPAPQMDYELPPEPEMAASLRRESAQLGSPLAVKPGEEPESRSLPPSKKRTKSKRVTVDERIELSDRVVKQRLADTQPILRRRADERLPFQQDVSFETSVLAGRAPGTELAAPWLAMEERIAQLPGYNLMCKELQWTVDICTNSRPLPFPSRLPPAAPAATTVSSAAGVAPSPIVPTPSVELARGMDTSTVERGRLSTLPAYRESIAGGRLSEERYEGFGAEVDLGPGPTYDYYEPSAGSMVGITTPSRDKLGAEMNRPPSLRPRARVEKTEHRLSDRTKNVLQLITQRFESQGPAVSFDGMCAGASRKSAACFFLETLQLKTWGLIDIHQPAAYADMTLSPA